MGVRRRLQQDAQPVLGDAFLEAVCRNPVSALEEHRKSVDAEVESQAYKWIGIIFYGCMLINKDNDDNNDDDDDVMIIIDEDDDDDDKANS